MTRLNSSDWKAVQNNIISQLLECNVGNGKVIYRSSKAIVIEIICTRSECEKCLIPKINELGGLLHSFVPMGEQGEGREYNYRIVFTKVIKDVHDFDMSVLDD